MSQFLENSLCQDCKFIDTCILTADKNFIWSCSEYEIVAQNHANTESQRKVRKSDFKSKKRVFELI